jgi:hypothetical protein
MHTKPAEPQTRVGICCGDACRAEHHATGTWSYALLFKIPGIYRYRCSTCFESETGYRHGLAVCLDGRPKPQHWMDTNRDGFSLCDAHGDPI